MKPARRVILFMALPALFFVGQLCSQPGGGDALSAGMTANAKLLRQYTYKQRTEIKFKGEGRFVRINQVHLDPDGKQEMTLISQTGGSGPASGLGKRIVEQKRQELQEYGNRITALVENYFPIDPQKMAAALAKAELGGSGNSISLIVKDYFKAGDSMSVIVDPANKKLQKVELKTLLDEDPVTVTADMAAIPKGPTYPSFIKVKAPAKDLEIDISQYDFAKP